MAVVVFLLDELEALSEIDTQQFHRFWIAKDEAVEVLTLYLPHFTVH